MHGESAPRLGLVIAFWAVIVAVIAFACAPVILALLIIAGVR